VEPRESIGVADLGGPATVEPRQLVAPAIGQCCMFGCHELHTALQQRTELHASIGGGDQRKDPRATVPRRDIALDDRDDLHGGTNVVETRAQLVIDRHAEDMQRPALSQVFFEPVALVVVQRARSFEPFDPRRHRWRLGRR
jgi:hypothetical protein